MKAPVWYLCLLAVGLFSTALAAPDQTWVLDPQEGWQDLSELPEGDPMAAISALRQQLSSGQRSEVLAALESLKVSYPHLAGDDMDAFIEAEKIYQAGRFGRAARLYKDFLETWPDSPFQPLAMERYFAIGTAFLQGEKRELLRIFRIPAFDDGVTIMRNIAEMTGNAPIALRALQVTAENQERRERYIEAYHTWAEIATRWPTGDVGRNALLRMARALHASYDGPDYDVSVLRSAQSYFEQYIQRYPQKAEAIELSETLTLITEQLAYKAYETGFYYERVNNVAAAHHYYNSIIEQWPETSAARKAEARLAPDPDPAVKPTFQRGLFDAAGGFLDSWFGLGLLFGSSDDDAASEVN